MGEETAKAYISGAGVTGKVYFDASAPVSWTFRVGVDPHIGAFTLDATAADSLLQAGTAPMTLMLESEGRTLQVEKLYLVGSTGTIDPFRKTVMLADRRIWWPRRRFFGRFNVSRRSGERRRMSQDGVPIESQANVADVTYAEWSLDDGSPWTSQRVATRVLDTIAAPWAGDLIKFMGVPVQDFDIDDDGGAAVLRALRLLGGADVWIDRQGMARIIDTLDVTGLDKQMEGWMKSAPPNATGRYPSRNRRGHLRPKLFRVWLPVEQEIRFDAVEENDSITREGRWMKNVCPVPDATLSINGATVVQGTWKPISDLITPWNADSGGAPAISLALLRQFWVTPFPESYWPKLGQTAPLVNWIERVATCRAHYRQTWQVNRRWMDRILALKPWRVSIVDQETGTYGRAQAFAGYCIFPSTKGKFSDLFQQKYALNVDGSIEASQPLSEGRVAPCEVRVLDEHLGIIRLDYDKDFLGNYRQIVPSRITGVPTLYPDPKQNEHLITADGTHARGDSGFGVALAESNRVAIVLTAVPASPNSLAQFYPVDVLFRDARAVLPIRVQDALPDAAGDFLDIRVGGQIATARFAWSDAKALDIERSMGVGLPPGDARAGDRTTIQDLLLNPDEVKSLATSLAASYLARLGDHWAGGYPTRLLPDAAPFGSLRAVTHTLSTEGDSFTELSFGPEAAPIDPNTFLSPAARRLFLKMVQT